MKLNQELTLTLALMLSPLLLPLCLSGLPAQAQPATTGEATGYVKDYLDRQPWVSILVFTRHYDCQACLLSDVQTTPTLVARHYPVQMVDVDTNPELVAHFKITSCPTYVGLHQGRDVGQIVGVSSPDEVGRMFDFLRKPQTTQASPLTAKPSRRTR